MAVRRPNTELMYFCQATTTKEKYVPDVVGMGRRSLRLAALKYLTAKDSPEGRALATQAYNDATNMTEQVSEIGLGMAGTRRCGLRLAALECPTSKDTQQGRTLAAQAYSDAIDM